MSQKNVVPEAHAPSPSSAPPYRTHRCGSLNKGDLNSVVVLAGWIHNKRHHGTLLFVDLRDASGIVQIVSEKGTEAFEVLDAVRLESVIQVSGTISARTPETVNPKLKTGTLEVIATKATVLSAAETLPFQVHQEDPTAEDLRLQYRFLDLRRETMKERLMMRVQIIESLRRRMREAGFEEFHTPLLSSSSPEGARDFLVPSRLHPGQFYALPQAPQQFKQLLIASGIERYFQIAPCFRDEDSRKDRSPGEFYQLDFEMAFVDQETVFQTLEPILHGVFEEFSSATITLPPFPRIPYDESMARYGSDKPDLRNPLEIVNLTAFFRESGFQVFKKMCADGLSVKGIQVPKAAGESRAFFDKLTNWVKDQGAPGLAYVLYGADGPKGPLGKALLEAEHQKLRQLMDAPEGAGIFFLAGEPEATTHLAGNLRQKLGEAFNCIEKDVFRFCWITDFPMYEKDPQTGQIMFSHNPFSMPQGGLEALTLQDPLSIKAYQYDIVCNGIELSSGAIRNHLPDVMVKAFEIAGYDRAHLEENFGALFRAFSYGVPPHGGAAPGVDRMIMLLTGAENLRETIAFPLNQQAQDRLMGAPHPVSKSHLQELGLSVADKPPSPK